MNPYWSYLLTAVGVFGLYLAGRKDRRGWMVGIGAQVLWIAYATATHQWGFYFSALAYGLINLRNLRSWSPASGAGTPALSSGCTPCNNENRSPCPCSPSCTHDSADNAS